MIIWILCSDLGTAYRQPQNHMQPDIKYLQTRCEECGMVIKTGQFKGGGNSVGKAVKQGFSDEDLTCFQNSDRTSLVIQWLRLCASTAGGTDLIPGWGTKILWAMWHSQKKKNYWQYLDWWGGSRKVCKLADPYKGAEARFNKVLATVGWTISWE